MNDIGGIFIVVGEEESLWSECLDPQVWVPVALAIVSFLFGSWIRTIFSRREASRRAVMYLNEIYEEIDNGVRLLHYWFDHGGVAVEFCGHVPMMTTQAWKGCSAVIPDDVYQRILNVAYRTRKCDAISLRSHLKNYYVCICSHYERVVNKKLPFNAGYYRNDVDGADMVKNLVKECREMMEQNSHRIFWPW